MQNPPENLIYLLVLALAYFANYLFKRFVPRMEPEPPQAEVDQGQTAQEPVPVGLAAASIASLTPLPGPQVAVAKAMLPTPPRGQLPRFALLGSKRNKQTAIAMATILGPCRAFEADGNPASAGR
jgi:hypothetical protein